MSEKPFVASPTNKAIYEDCKHAIELYEKKDPKYAMTACVGEIRGAIAVLYSIIARNPQSDNKVLGMVFGCKNMKFNHSTQEHYEVVMIKRFLDQYQNSTNRSPDVRNEFGFIPYIADYERKNCNKGEK